MLNLTIKAFNEKVGSEVVGLDAIDKVARKAVNQGYVGKTIPIILHTTNEKLVVQLAQGVDQSKGLRAISRNVFVITAGTVKDKKIKQKSLTSLSKINKTSVEKSLVRIKESIA